jgi:hypothetical protein
MITLQGVRTVRPLGRSPLSVRRVGILGSLVRNGQSLRWGNLYSTGGASQTHNYISRQRPNGIVYSMATEKIILMHVWDNNEKGPGVHSPGWKFVK